MAVTNAITLQTAGDGTRMVLATVTPDSSYDSGGEAITANSVGLSRITGAIPAPATNTTLGLVPSWDQTNQKLLIFQQDGTTGGLAQTSGDKSAYVFSVLFFGV